MSESNAPISRRKLLKRGFAVGALALAGDAFGVEPEWLQVERVSVPIHGLAPAFDGYRIALFADVHWPHCIHREVIRRAVGLANAFDPDLIAIPGDLCDNKGTYEVPDVRGLFDGLRARDGIVGTLGNHDHKLNDVPELRRRIARDTPVEIVENRHRIIRRGAATFALGGVGDLRYGVVDPVAAFQGVPESVPRIMLSHNPDVAEKKVWPTRIDLQLSGHTHGGEIVTPFFGFAPFTGSEYGQKFRAGLVQGRSHRVYVTRGICAVAHARFMCRPEVTYLTLRAA